jgi:DUF2950 family protein
VKTDRAGPGILPVLAILGACGLAAGFFAWWLPKRAMDQIAANERAATESLKRLAAAEVDFRWNDRDRNGVHDFWVGDVSGLHSLIDLRSPASPIRLIPFDLARADARAVAPGLPSPVPLEGYYFVAMRFHQDDLTGNTVAYGEDTDGSGTRYRNRTSFGFCAYPAEYGVTGRHTFVINEGTTILKFDMGGLPLIRWPWDDVLRADYEKLD